jgi:hypothetical protein
MPLHDHFRPPVCDRLQWNSFHGGWPAEIVRSLYSILPDGFQARPKVQIGTAFEFDIKDFDRDPNPSFNRDSGGGTATLEITQPSMTIAADLAEVDEIEVNIYDTRIGTLVASIELVSPANKDRPKNRDQFLNKIATLLKHDVCVVIVDIVSTMTTNFTVQLFEYFGQHVAGQSIPDASMSAVTLRGRKMTVKNSFLDAWYYPMKVGQPLPTVPIFLNDVLHINLPLESSYQEVCRLLRVG